LPELRGGSDVPFYFQIIDYDSSLGGRILRERFDTKLIFSEDYNGCNLPAECVDDSEESDGAASLLTSFTAASSIIALASSLLAF